MIGKEIAGRKGGKGAGSALQGKRWQVLRQAQDERQIVDSVRGELVEPRVESAFPRL